MTVSHTGIHALSKGAYRVAWCGLGTESGAACSSSAGSTVIIPSRYDSITIQVLGTFAGSSISIEGSNDGGATWAILNDSRGEGNAATFTSANLVRLNEAPQMIRPTITSGSGSDVDVLAIIRAQP